jgi:putative DNA primase/helicase
MLALSIAFAAPLLKLVNEESRAIHLVGNSSMGKTTALNIAASVWGGGRENGFIKQWRTTCNALEVVAETHRDCLLPLDELSQADSKSVGDMVYMLANNQGKARLKSSITLRNLNQWRVLILSSGEVTLQTKIEESGKKALVGMEVRFVSIQADAGNSYGIFENLHEFASGETLSKYLKEASTKYYGTAIRAFLE